MTDQERLVNLVNQIRDGADIAGRKGWVATQHKLFSAAGSIEWQLNWERKHPK